MRTSELIKSLQEKMENYGDKPVVIELFANDHSCLGSDLVGAVLITPKNEDAILKKKLEEFEVDHFAIVNGNIYDATPKRPT